MSNYNELLLGKKVKYPNQYNFGLLQEIPRILNRETIGLTANNCIYGFDCWNLYELSWLNINNMPQVAIGELYVPANSPNIIESKSLKLYLNSFNQSKFESWDLVQSIMEKDLTKCAGAKIKLYLHNLNNICYSKIVGFEGICLDSLDLKFDNFEFNNNLLVNSTGSEIISERLYSNLLKSNCLITNQPDWGSILIDYTGKAICHEKLLRYLISFRLHNEFHEQCVERIFTDLKKFCNPSSLTVYARYTRRGGLDINPYRSSLKFDEKCQQKLNTRLIRQ